VRLGRLGFTLKKLIKYRERNEVQRWRFRRELEKLAAQLWAAFKTRLRKDLPTAANPLLVIANMSQCYY
jgi:hypothetical protein